MFSFSLPIGRKILILGIFLGQLLSGTALASVNYDIVYVKQPRNGDNAHIEWPEAFAPARLEPNSDLVLLHPDGTEEILVDTIHGAVTDPFVSFDGKWVYYSYFYDLRPERLNYQRGYLPKDGADIFKINLETREIVQLTFQEFTPNTGSGNWDESNPVDPPSGFNRLGYGVINSGPAPIAGGKIVFTSSRNGYKPVKSYTNPNMQLYVMDEDGSNVTPIAPMTLGSALHPTPLTDGRIMFSSYESQGLRDRRNWGVWSIWPDGRNWAPVVSAFKPASVFHFMTQLSGGDIVVEDYYNLNNFGFGALYRLPSELPPGEPGFYNAFPSENPSIEQSRQNGDPSSFRMPFTPKGMYSITPMTNAQDNASPEGDEGRVGKFTHPSAAPNNDLLVVWSGGPVNKLTRPVNLPAVDSGIYVMPNGNPVNSPSELQLVKNDPNFNEAWPRAVVPYQQIYGIEEPKQLPWLPNDGSLHAALPEGTPFGLVGSSSFYKRESFPGIVTSYSNTFDGLDAFNTTQNGQSGNWLWQGADAGRYDDSDIWAVRVLAMEPNSDRGYGPNASPNGGVKFYNHANERLRILGEIPLRKFDASGDPILDTEGNPDTSFLAKIPADTPFTFQTLDKNGLVLNMSQTWHQVRPGEMRADCGGCHAHSEQPLAFNQTAAASPDFPVADLSHQTPLLTLNDNNQPEVKTVSKNLVDVEFYQDIRPVLERSCTQCHTGSVDNPPAQLVLDDHQMYDGLPGDYKRLCSDTNAEFGIPPLVEVSGKPRWRQTNASRYVRKFQSRRSLLMWKLFGERLDGWSNEDHPSATIPGDASTLPDGAKINESDLDYTGNMMPPPNSGVPALSNDEKMTFARWIDLGCPIDNATGTTSEGLGWFLDEVKPTLTINQPRAGQNPEGIDRISLAVADANSGIKNGSLSLVADFTVAGRQAGENLADLLTTTGNGIFTLPAEINLAESQAGTISASVEDNQGNISRLRRTFYSNTDSTPNRPPVAVITVLDTTMVANQTLNLDANASSDPDNDTLSYQWTIVSGPDNHSASLSGSATSTSEFSATQTGIYIVRLEASDQSASSNAEVTITVREGPGDSNEDFGNDDHPIPRIFALSDNNNLFSGDINDAITLPHAEVYDTDVASLELVFTTYSVELPKQGLFSKEASGFGNGGYFSVSLVGDDIHVQSKSLSHESNLYARNLVKPDQKHHLVVTLGESGFKLFVDGLEAVSVSSWSESLRNNSEPIVIGASQKNSAAGSPDGLDAPFSGSIEQANLYDLTLSDEEVILLACLNEIALEGAICQGDNSDQENSFFEQTNLAFDGTIASAAIFPHEDNYELSQGSIALVVTPNATSASRVGIVSKDSSGYDNGGHFGIFMRRDDLEVRMQDTDSQATLTVNDVFQVGQSSTINVSFGLNGLKVFVDGELRADNPNWLHGLQGNQEPIVLGANQWSSGDGIADKIIHPFNGIIESIMLFDSEIE